MSIRVTNPAQQPGLLTLSDSARAKAVSSCEISVHYTVEHTPFARGKFAAVRKCRHRGSDVEFAAKFIRRRRRASEVVREIEHEIAVLELARTAAARDVPGAGCIVRLQEAFQSTSESALVLEMMSGGDLQQVIDVDECLSESQTRVVLQQTLLALRFLHERRIAHLDLKPQNILLSAALPDCAVKLCDFGISRLIEPGVEVREIVGTPDYVAPEVLQYEPISLATDMWSVGVLVYVLLSGRSPFAGDNKQQTFCNITQGLLDFPDELFSEISAGAQDFISALIVLEATERMSVADSVQHSWLTGSSASVSPGNITTSNSYSRSFSSSTDSVDQLIVRRHAHDEDDDDETTSDSGFSSKVIVLDKKAMRQTGGPAMSTV